MLPYQKILPFLLLSLIINSVPPAARSMENAIGEIASLWVFFHDGEREHNLGTIDICPKLTFKEFQMLICHGIRLEVSPNQSINPNQVLIYLVRTATFPEDQARILITEKVNFEFIIRQKDTSYFHVNFKKPKRFYATALDYCYNYVLQTPASTVMYQPDGYQIYDYPTTFKPLAADVAVIMDDQLQERIMQLELAVATAPEPIDIRVSDLDLGPGFILNNDCNYEWREKFEDKAKAFCKECALAEKDEDGIGSFHCCVNDPVIVGFRNSAGPIACPIKASDGTIEPYVFPEP